ncbi:MAG TPA: response regulator [Kofleriaceae bacterium]
MNKFSTIAALEAFKAGKKSGPLTAPMHFTWSFFRSYILYPEEGGGVVRSDAVIGPIRILLVEDSDDDAALIVRALRRADLVVEVERVEDPDALREALAASRCDAVICDWSLPKLDALGALAIFRASGVDLPFIIVSGTIGEELAVTAMRAGAHDYVLKDKLGRLPAALEREVRDSQTRADHRQQERRFRALIEKSSETIVLTDHAGIIVYASTAATALFGVKRSELIGRRNREFVHPDDLEMHAHGMVQVRDGQPLHAHEIRLLRPDGSIRWVEVAVTNLLDDPAIGGVVTNLRDITERTIAAQALRAAEEQLRQAQKMEAVGRLAGGIAHDFNNLLSVIVSYAEMLQEDLAIGDPRRDDAAEILAASKRATGLTRQLLMFSRQQVIEPRVLDLDELLGNMEKMMQRVLGEDIELARRAQTVRPVKADPSSIEQVVMNLIVNARDAMPTGGALTLETRNVELDEDHVRRSVAKRAGPHVMIAVTDTGIGMDEATRARIFEPFFTTKPKDKGTGLGLSTVFGIVHQVGGGIEVETELGKGTTFRVFIPCVDGELSVERAPVARPEHGTETILLVEDDPQVRAVTGSILRRHGYRVLDAGSPTAALALSAQHAGPIHLLLSDVVMPAMSGPELAKRLEPLRPATKVLFMSGYTDDAVLRHGVQTSQIALIQKPLSPATLAHRVREMLDRPAAGAGG